jgi:endonuclease YncB( thermonuclease family)
VIRSPFLVLLLSCTQPAGPSLVVGEVCDLPRERDVGCVVDGDTFDIVLAGGSDCGGSAERIRMLGIDAPETSSDDCYADTAWAALEELLDEREVELTFDVDCTGVYGRTLAYVYLTDPWEDGDTEEVLFVNEWMLEEGYAELYDEAFADDIRQMDTLAAAESRAQAGEKGLWGDCR